MFHTEPYDKLKLKTTKNSFGMTSNDLNENLMHMEYTMRIT